MQYAMLCHLVVYVFFVFCPKTVLCKIYVLLRHLTCQCRSVSCKTKYYLNTLYVSRKIYMCCFDISHVIAAVLECIAGLLLAERCRQMPIAFTISAFPLRILHCLDTSTASDSRTWARTNSHSTVPLGQDLFHHFQQKSVHGTCC